jgi:hypothetical protein
MNAVWVVVGLGIAGAFVALLGSWRRGDRPADLGTVSNRWIAEQKDRP